MTDRIRGSVVTISDLGTIAPTLRFNPPYFEEQFIENERALLALGAEPLGRFIPDFHPDGSKGITYGQVGKRKGRGLDPRGNVRYLQVINIRDTGIDLAIKPDRVVGGSEIDPSRSRVSQRDILLTNTGFRGTETLLGRCVVVHRDYGKLNISQDIDRIRVSGINPYYVGAFLKSPFAQLQLQRRLHGVDSQKINFGQIKNLVIPEVTEAVENEVERQYIAMAESHDEAMAIKEHLLAQTRVSPGQYGEEINSLANERPAYRTAMANAKARLDHVLRELVAVIERRQKQIRPFRE